MPRILLFLVLFDFAIFAILTNAYREEMVKIDEKEMYWCPCGYIVQYADNWAYC